MSKVDDRLETLYNRVEKKILLKLQDVKQQNNDLPERMSKTENKLQEFIDGQNHNFGNLSKLIQNISDDIAEDVNDKCESEKIQIQEFLKDIVIKKKEKEQNEYSE